MRRRVSRPFSLGTRPRNRAAHAVAPPGRTAISPPEASARKTPPQPPPPARRPPQDAIDATRKRRHDGVRPRARLIRSLTQMGGGPAPWAPANLAGTAAIFGASAVCTVAYTLWGSSGVPGTHKSSAVARSDQCLPQVPGGGPDLVPGGGQAEILTPTMKYILLMAAASALTTRRVLLLASTSDNARRLLNDLDEASSRLDVPQRQKLSPRTCRPNST